MRTPKVYEIIYAFTINNRFIDYVTFGIWTVRYEIIFTQLKRTIGTTIMIILTI